MAKIIGPLTSTPALWPETLIRKFDAKPLIYFDQFAWIKMCSAANGSNRNPEYLRLATWVIEASRSNLAHFVISSVTYMECQSISNPRQRVEVGSFIARVSRLETITPRHISLKHELSASLSQLFNLPPLPDEPFVGTGVRHAFGQPTLEFLNISNLVQSDTSNYKNLQEQIENTVELAMLTGSTGFEESDTDNSYKTIGLDIARGRALFESNLTEMLNEDAIDYRKSKIFELIAARELTNEVLPIFMQISTDCDFTFDDFLALGLDEINKVMCQMPGMKVTIGIKADRHQNRQRKWNQNSIFDIRHMETAIPYCDLVMADKEISTCISALELDKQLNTKVTHNPETALHMIQDLLNQ